MQLSNLKFYKRKYMQFIFKKYISIQIKYLNSALTRLT